MQKLIVVISVSFQKHFFTPYWSSPLILDPFCVLYIYIYIYFILDFFFEINHATSSNLYRSYYPHRSRELVSPVCGIFIWKLYIITVLDNFSRIFFKSQLLCDVWRVMHDGSCTTCDMEAPRGFQNIWYMQCVIPSKKLCPPDRGNCFTV